MSEPSENRQVTGLSTKRFETFSDGVFAVAITLLVLNLQVPPRHKKTLLAIVGALALGGSVSLIYACAETPNQTPAAAAPPIATISITPPPDLTAKEISFQSSDAITLHGTILQPATPMTRRPGVVLVHGSGAGTPRTKLLEEATAFARQGLAILIYARGRGRCQNRALG